MNNLRKFSTEADYTAATLNYPAVSWVVSGDTVHFDKAAPSSNDKVLMGFLATEDGNGIVMYNCGASESTSDIADIYINDDNVGSANCSVSNYTSESVYYTVKYTLADGVTSINDWFSGQLGEGDASGAQSLEICFPPQTTTVDYWPDNTSIIICQATTPPELNANFSAISEQAIYVPDESLSDYLNSSWNDNNEDKFHGISDYSGNLPI